MIRKAEQQLLKWKNSITRKPLLINGARQVGKTYLVEKIFAPKYFNKFLEIDLRADSQSRKFIKNHPNAKEILNYLSLRFNTIIDSDTLIFFDEIQEAVQILTACKYFNQDYPEIPIIMAGSLVRIRLKQLELENEKNKIKFDVEIEKENQDGHNNFLYPVGKLDKLDMFPLTYDEFLDSFNRSLASLLKESLKNKTPLNESYHQLALDSFYIYLQVGGIPDDVSTFLKTASINEAQ